MWHRCEAGAPCQTMHACALGKHGHTWHEAVALSRHVLHLLQLQPGSLHKKLNHPNSCLLLVKSMTIERGPPCRGP